MMTIKKHINFKWLLEFPAIKENRPPNENTLVYNGTSFSIKNEEITFVKNFYSRYIYEYRSDLIISQLEAINNETAKTWVKFAISRIPIVTKYENKKFEKRLKNLLYRIKYNRDDIIDIFRPYMPFMTSIDIYRFATKNLDSSSFHYFYLLLILWYNNDFPIDYTKTYFYNYHNCPKRKICKYKDKCISLKRCYKTNLHNKDYDYIKELNTFQKNLTLEFLSTVPSNVKGKALVKLYDALQQINQTGLFDGKLSLSYEKILYSEGKPMSGHFFLKWDKVDFFDGYYIIKHPDVPFNKVPVYRIMDKDSRKAFNDISNLFLKKLPPLYVEAKNGQIILVLNKENLSSCISIMEHKVNRPDILYKKKSNSSKTEKKELTSSEAKSFCKKLKSRYLDYLCSKHLDKYKVICCVEHCVNSTGIVSCEYSFIFTIKENTYNLYLAYENASASRCTYILPIYRNSWQESIEKIYIFFASNEVNKRQSMASRLVDLKLPGNYEYQRILHSDYLKWVDKIKYCR